jgi:hypothetical protein
MPKQWKNVFITFYRIDGLPGYANFFRQLPSLGNVFDGAFYANVVLFHNRVSSDLAARLSL